MFWGYDYYKNHQAFDVKDRIVKNINRSFLEQKPIELDRIGGVDWEQICFISYELNGNDVSDGLDIPFKYLKIPKNAFSQIANESYWEFEGGQYGLVFFTTKQKMFIAITLGDVNKTPYFECHEAKNLVLQNHLISGERLVSLAKR